VDSPPKAEIGFEVRLVSATVGTPWGQSSELKKRKLHPGSGTPRAEVVRNQRERLFGAVVAVVSEKGYEATTVADVIEVCGVSRSDFYRHFANKAECLAAAAEALLELALRELDGVRGGGGEVEARAIFERFVGLVGSEPAAARVCLVELYAAGEEGEAVADRGSEALAEIFDELAAELPGQERIGPDLIRVLVGGLGKLIQTRLYRDEDGELESLAPELWGWLRSVRPPPRPLEAPRRQRPSAAPFEGYTPAERIARAVAAVVAEKGYGAMNTDDIAARAAISLSTFYEHFADKRDAVLAALEMSGAQIMALAVPAARRADDWQEGVRALYEAICAYFVAEPAMAELATVGVYGAGPATLARRDRVIDSLAAMLAPGFEEEPAAPAVSAEASGASVYALMRGQVRRKGPQKLADVVPLATYITLVPFVGPERACAVATGDGRRR
jgi:AcrR family transcriptional regulator